MADLTVLTASFDENDRGTTGRLTLLDWGRRSLRERASLALERPSYLAPGPRGSVYVSHELPDSRVSLVGLGPDGMRVLDERQVPGRWACHLSVHPSGRWIGVAPYASPLVALLGVDEAGRFTSHTSTVEFDGSGPNAQRQEAPHPHQFVFSPDGRQAFVPDLGSDRIHVLSVDGSGRLESEADLELPPGTGPRHLVLTRRYLAVCGELDGRVYWTRRNRPADWRSVAATAAAQGQPSAILRWSGRDSVLVASRSPGTVRALALGDDGARVLLDAHAGQAPRDVIRRGARLLVADRPNDELLALEPDGEGMRVAARFAVPTPACILPVRGAARGERPPGTPADRSR